MNKKESGRAHSPGRGNGKNAADEIEQQAAKDAGDAPRAQTEQSQPGQKQPAQEQTTPEDAGAPENGGASEDAGKDASAAEQTVSESDVLKIYLQQSLEEIRRLKGELESLRKERDSLESQSQQIAAKYGALASEYDNYRRRTAAEKETIHDDAVAEAVAALLPALDSLERAMDFADSNSDSFKQGVGMTLRQLSDGFQKLGVSEIEAQSQPFDPDKHNAVMHVEDETLGDSVVTEVFQKGYRIGDRVIRHSMVKVAN